MVTPQQFLTWYRTPLRPARPNAGRWLIAITIGLLLVALLFPWGSDLQASVLIVAVGVFTVSAALLRPAWYWRLMRERMFAGAVGDRGAVVIWLLFSLWVLSIGIRLLVREFNRV